MGDKLRVAVIGAGAHAQFAHFPSLSEMDDIDLVAVCDIDSERREEAAARWGFASAYGDYREMLDKEKLDAVYAIVLPQHVFEMSVDVIRRRKALFVEKPPGLTSYQTGRLAHIADETGAITFVGFNRRYAPLLVEARRLMEERGPIDHMVVTFSKFGGTGKPPYYEGAADVLTYDAIHAVDMIRWLGGEPESVAAVTRVSHKDQNEKYVALMRFAGGRTGFLNCTWDSGRRTLSAELHGSDSCAFVDIEERLRFFHAGREKCAVTAGEFAGSDAPHLARGYFQESRAFIECVRSGRRPENDLADAFKTMQLAERLCFASV